MTNEQATTRHILKCGKESAVRVCDRKRVNLTGCQWFVVVGCSRHQILARYKYNYMPGVRVAGAACSFTLNHWVEWCSLSLSLWFSDSASRSLARIYDTYMGRESQFQRIPKMGMERAQTIRNKIQSSHLTNVPNVLSNEKHWTCKCLVLSSWSERF